MCDYGSWRKRNGFGSYEQCAEHYAEEIADHLGLAESRYEQVDRRMAAREGVYESDRARRDRVAGDLARGLSSVAAEVSGAPVNIPTVTIISTAGASRAAHRPQFLQRRCRRPWL